MYSTDNQLVSAHAAWSVYKWRAAYNDPWGWGGVGGGASILRLDHRSFIYGPRGTYNQAKSGKLKGAAKGAARG